LRCPEAMERDPAEWVPDGVWDRDAVSAGPDAWAAPWRRVRRGLACVRSAVIGSPISVAFPAFRGFVRIAAPPWFGNRPGWTGKT